MFAGKALERERHYNHAKNSTRTNFIKIAGLNSSLGDGLMLSSETLAQNPPGAGGGTRCNNPLHLVQSSSGYLKNSTCTCFAIESVTEQRIPLAI